MKGIGTLSAAMASGRRGMKSCIARNWIRQFVKPSRCAWPNHLKDAGSVFVH
jgi:hypothetical protein